MKRPLMFLMSKNNASLLSTVLPVLRDNKSATVVMEAFNGLIQNIHPLYFTLLIEIYLFSIIGISNQGIVF